MTLKICEKKITYHHHKNFTFSPTAPMSAMLKEGKSSNFDAQNNNKK
jgi:hypothetical protein